MNKLFSTFALASLAMIAGCKKDQSEFKNDRFTSTNSSSVLVSSGVPLGSAASFAVLGGTTVTNSGVSLIAGDVGVSPGTALTGFDLSANTIVGPGTVTSGSGIVNGTIYAGGPIAAQAHNDAVTTYNYLQGLTPDSTFSGVTELDGITFTPGIYSFAPSANLQVNGNVYLDFQGNSNAQFIFLMGTTLVTKTGSNVIALNNGNASCQGSNVFWAVGSSATIDGDKFIGTVIANTTITMTSGGNISGRMLALNGAVTMIADTISVCEGAGGTTTKCRDFVTGGGWVNGKCSDKATFGVSGGIKNGKFWGQLSFNDHSKNCGVKVKGTSVTAYIIIDKVTRQIEGTAKIDGKGSYTYKLIVVDNGEPGKNDKFTLELSNGYTVSGILNGGNIQLHMNCDKPDKDDRDKYDDKDERDGHDNCDKDDDDNKKKHHKGH